MFLYFTHGNQLTQFVPYRRENQIKSTNSAMIIQPQRINSIVDYYLVSKKVFGKQYWH